MKRIEPDVDAATMLRLIKTIKYLVGIAERGEGRKIADDETPEQFVLGYVKRLEQTNSDARAKKLAEVLSKILENEASDWKAAEEFGGYVLDDELREEARAALEKEKDNEQ